MKMLVVSIFCHHNFMVQISFTKESEQSYKINGYSRGRIPTNQPSKQFLFQSCHSDDPGQVNFLSSAVQSFNIIYACECRDKGDLFLIQLQDGGGTGSKYLWFLRDGSEFQSFGGVIHGCCHPHGTFLTVGQNQQSLTLYRYPLQDSEGCILVRDNPSIA